MTNPTPISLSASARRRRLSLGLLILAGALAGAIYWVFFSGPRLIEPPAPELAGVDPAIRAAVEEALTQVRQTPRSAEAWGRLGMVLESHIFGNEALACFAQAERLEPDNPRWPYHQGLIRLAYDPPAALPKIRRAMELCRDETDGPRLRLAELHLALGETDDAQQHFEALLRLQPQHPRAHLGLARLYFNAADLVPSTEHLQVALSHPLTRKSALALSAELHGRQGDSKTAQQDRAQAIELPDEPEWPDVYANEAAKLKVGESARLRLAGQLLDRKRSAEAGLVLQKVVQDYPRSAQAWALMGWAQLDQGLLAEAEQSLRAAVDLEPELARAWMYRGIVRFKQKDRREAIAFFRKAIAAKPSYLEAHFNLGRCLKEEGEAVAAIAAFRDCLRCQPLSAPAHANLGELLLKQGRQEQAVSHLQQAVDLNPDDSASRKLLEEAHR